MKPIRFTGIADAMSYVRLLQKPNLHHAPEVKPLSMPPQRRELIAGGDPVRSPVNKSTAMVIAPAAWWAQPQPILSVKPKAENKNRNIKMANINEETARGNSNGAFDQTGTAMRNGVRIRRVNGEDVFNEDDLHQAIIRTIDHLPKETRPLVAQARDCREVVNELLHGIAGEVREFREASAKHIELIRSTRYTVLSETGQMMHALKDVRQFFMGSDHKDQVARLREFVELCERLQNLKNSGFLDDVADTILKLDRPSR